jgi:hypothetical protein
LTGARGGFNIPCDLAASSACGVMLLAGAGMAGIFAKDAAAGLTEG